MSVGGPSLTAAKTDSGRSVPVILRERRWWLLLLAVWTLVVGLALQSHIARIDQQSMQIALEGDRNMFRTVVLTRNWNSSHGGVYVPVTAKTQPNPYLDHPRRDLMTTDGVALTMVNPAYMTRLIAEMAESDSGAIFRLTSLKPVRPENAPDNWEAKALLAFEQGIKEFSGVELTPKGEMLRYMAPLLVKESCLACHARQGYKIGDIRGGISISQPYAPIATATHTSEREAILTYGTGFALVVGLGWLLLEMLRRRWHELAGKIQELEDTQGQLLQSEKLASIGQLAAGVAHEINNPVGFVNSNLGTLGKYSGQLIELLEACRTGKADDASFAAADFDYLKTDIADLLKESQEGLGRVRKIVADLKDFSRVDQAEWQDADLNAGIESTLNVVWNEIKYKAEVVRDYGELPPVPCLPAQINQVVMNLLVNAAQSIESKGRICVRTGHDAQWAWIEIEDNGKGMTPEVMQRIFEPFYTTKPVGKGTGLGLSLAYDIVRKHGGRLEVSSEPGQGSLFRVSLPLQGIPGESAPK